MKKIIFVFFILSFFISSTFAEEIYTYKDKDGNIIISNEPVPEKYVNKVKKVESLDKDSPEAIEKYQEKEERKRALKEERDYYRQVRQEERQAQKELTPKRSIDESCKRECSIDRSTCESDCSRGSSTRYNTHDYEIARCKRSCMTFYDKCVDRCWK